MSEELPDWLPPLVTMEDHNHNWDAYLSAIHRIFLRDFGGQRPDFRGRRMGLKRHPIIEGMSATFWHFISEGMGEDDRTVDFRRCERIAWPLAIIKAVDRGDILCWEQSHGRNLRIILALPDFSYVVILADRGEFVLPWTAYCVERSHQRTKLERAFKAWSKAQKS
jgi:hypothetical protein